MVVCENVELLLVKYEGRSKLIVPIHHSVFAEASFGGTTFSVRLLLLLDDTKRGCFG